MLIERPRRRWCDKLFEFEGGRWYYCRLDPGHDGDCSCPASIKGE